MAIVHEEIANKQPPMMTAFEAGQRVAAESVLAFIENSDCPSGGFYSSESRGGFEMGWNEAIKAVTKHVCKTLLTGVK